MCNSEEERGKSTGTNCRRRWSTAAVCELLGFGGDAIGRQLEAKGIENRALETLVGRRIEEVRIGTGPNGLGERAKRIHVWA